MLTERVAQATELSSHSSRGWKAKVEGLAGSPPPEAALPGRQTAAVPLCPRGLPSVPAHLRCPSVQIAAAYEDTYHTGSGPTPTASF